jgi:hypothetical protein
VRSERDVVLEDALRSAVDAGTTIPFIDLCNGLPIEDDLAAAQSEALVGYIASTYGDASVRNMVTALAGGDDCATAARKSIQLTPEQLETAWLRSISGDQGSRDVAEISVWLALVLAGFGLAGLLLLRPRRS